MNWLKICLKMRREIALFGVLSFVVTFQACSGVGFGSASSSSNGTNTATGGGGGSTTTACNNGQLQSSTTPIKMLIVVDLSGSNAGLYQGCSPACLNEATDLNKVMRDSSIQAFFNTYGSKTNFSWGLIAFQNASATAVGSTGFVPGSGFQTDINDFLQIPDGGETPYQAAITLATQTIQADASAAANTKYIVVFLSDGMPTDYTATATQSINAQAEADVTALINLRPGQITFNSVYYGNEDAATAPVTMQGMAAAGNGQFLNTTTNPTNNEFVINSVVTVPGANCQ